MEDFISSSKFNVPVKISNPLLCRCQSFFFCSLLSYFGVTVTLLSVYFFIAFNILPEIFVNNKVVIIASCRYI